MNTYLLRTIRSWPFLARFLFVLLFTSSASALVMRESGPEPIIVQIKESLRLSDDLDNRLSQLAAVHNQSGLTVQKWYAGNKLLVMLSFPRTFTEQQAAAVITALKQLPAVEKVVAASAANLEFKTADFARGYASNQVMPEHARRGLDRDELSRSPMTEAQIDEAAQAPHVQNQLIVRWKSRHVWRATAAGFLRDVANFHAAGGARVIREMKPSPTDLTQVIEVDDLVTPFADKLRRYVECPWVDYAQPNFIYTLDTGAPNDPLYTNPGQLSLARISAPDAWFGTPGNTGTTGTQTVVVAVADTGANINHPDLSPTPPGTSNISPGWRNYDVDPKNDPNTDVHDQNGHGSLVASIIGAKGNNGLLMTGVAWNVSLLIVKAGDNSADTVKFSNAIRYAYSNDGHDPAVAINVSSSVHSGGIDPTMQSAVRDAQANNMVVVASGGNATQDAEVPSHFTNPASLPTDNMIAVAATKVNPSFADQITGYSNFAQYRIELGAPGGDGFGADTCNYGVIGLLPNATDTWTACSMPVGWQRGAGTSFAAPHVTGAIALVKSKYVWEDYAGLRDRVIMATDDVPALNGLCRTGGRLNLAKALKPRTLITNWSTRARVESGDRIIIGGFTIGGSPAVPLKVVIRGIGPSLTAFGISNALPDPELVLNNSEGKQFFSNEDWQDDPAQAAELMALGFAPSDAHEAAMVVTLYPGSYTVLMQSQDGQQGVGLFDFYEIRGATTEETRLRNFSARCPVGVGNEYVIAGITLQNPGPTPWPKRRILTLGRGPSLQLFGLTGLLADPYLEFRDSVGGLIEDNNQWKDIDGSTTGLEDKLIEPHPGFMPSTGEQYLNESALWPTFTAGSYTAILRGNAGATGLGLIEFYEY